jgi:hypothetical protein
MVWKKGQSGNPEGARCFRDKPIAILARHHAPAAMHCLVRIMKDTTAPHAARVSASQAVLDRAWGKAPTFSTSDATAFKRAVDMSDDELAAIVAKARGLTVVK